MAFLRVSLTDKGLRRVTLAEEGPVFVTSAVMEMSDRGRVPVAFIPDPEPPSRGQTRVILAAPSGGGHMTGAELIAEDGTAIFRVDGDAVLSDGDHVIVPVTLS